MYDFRKVRHSKETDIINPSKTWANYGLINVIYSLIIAFAILQ